MKKNKSSDYIRYRNGKWIKARKRIYLYWYKYLQLAEADTDFEVDWTKYRGWGGRRVVLNQKFDVWWEQRWERLFGIANKNNEPRYALITTQTKAEAIRLDLLVYENRHKGSHHAIADFLRKDQERRKRRVSSTLKVEDVESYEKAIVVVSRHMKRAKQRLERVCEGKFP